MISSLLLGKKGEQLACEYLQNKGYLILQRNQRTPAGEIDIIAQKKDFSIVFIEVKTRINSKKGYPEEAVNKRKMIKIQKNIQYYLLNNKKIKNYQIDVIAIIMDDLENVKYFRHIQNAF
jgi:putative endonuclease